MARLNLNEAVLVVVDVQERFMPVLFEPQRLVSACQLLIGGAKILGLPILVTEQLPEKLGPTVTELREVLGSDYRPIVKAEFSAFANESFRRAFAATGRTQLILCGIEAHVCIRQTTLDALDLGYDVFLVEDAISSRYEFLYRSGVQSCVEAGARRTNAEAVLFELMTTAEHPQFREVQNLVKSLAPKIYGNG
ncbi:isochorismatase family protein [Fervidibacter sacchari]|uniref:Nicotinamidase-related amidase n=1 Tax=Candidatus Fervidibacter sacchari TaxID=1448929 RepID=A0ABT2EPT8_9BACT|nr:isochorismatase family protein [Candidatus Fervidibacter sacchari]MCS3918895.1 nicotinamidase-related amidase [Candidatus Fervidibacter sacchari]WKU17364.1 isochorismatase family protein [Candidatus Fervidibacter sacchari]